MRTPKKYTDNLKLGIITKDMLADCLYSVNKRAKNCRDKQRAYYGMDSYADKYREQKEKYYGQKEILLHLIQPTCIHMETVQRKQRIYDYEPEYDECFYNGLFFHEGGYYDREMQQYVSFGDMYVDEQKYYLFYDLGKSSFHTPIENYEMKKYPNLELVDIGRLITAGKDIVDLVSTQFVEKVLTIILSGEYQYTMED